MNILKNKTVILIAFLAAVSITPAMAAGKVSAVTLRKKARTG